MTTVGVWGASGFIGSALCAAAEAKGWPVRRLPRSGGTLHDLQGIDVAYHCAGSVPEPDAAGYVGMTERFARQCAAAGVRRLVYLSTVAVYGPRRAGTIKTDTPLDARDAYARSRRDAEQAVRIVAADTKCQRRIVRVPTIIGREMKGSVIRRFENALRWGLFLHPGSADAGLACLGVRRLAALLVGMAPHPSAPEITQFADFLRWTDIARHVGIQHSRRIVRIPLPAMEGRLAVLASQVRYEDDTVRLFGADAGFPETVDDLTAALKPKSG